MAGDWPIWDEFADLLPEVQDWLQEHVVGDDQDFHEVLGIGCFNKLTGAFHFRIKWN
jgi:hypothetical protein